VTVPDHDDLWQAVVFVMRHAHQPLSEVKGWSLGELRRVIGATMRQEAVADE
jgi:hypothetical protein